jgi:hypothetical protein
VEQAVNIFTGDVQVNGLFCCVCGGENQAKLMVVPDRCSYERLGGVICDDCCRACEYYGACAERLSALKRHQSKQPHPEVPCPFHTMDTAYNAWLAFRRDPTNRAAFDNCDWLLRVACAKWDAYALDRRVSQ